MLHVWEISKCAFALFAPSLKLPYLVGPFICLQELTIERGFVLHGIQAQQPAVVERVVLRRLAYQVAQTLQLTEKHSKET